MHPSISDSEQAFGDGIRIPSPQWSQPKTFVIGTQEPACDQVLDLRIPVGLCNCPQRDPMKKA